MTKITAIHSGGDWYDASANYLVLPDNMDIEREQTKYDKWYNSVYLRLQRRERDCKYLSFTEWLMRYGAREPTEDELEIVETM